MCEPSLLEIKVCMGSLLLSEKAGKERVVSVFELLIHYKEHSHVVIVKQVNFSKVKALRESACFVCKEEPGGLLHLSLKRERIVG